MLWEHHLLRLYIIVQLIQATTAPTPPSSKPRLLMACTDGWLPVIDDTSTMTTWVKSYQLSMIQVQWQSEWRVINYQRYDEYNLSEKLPVINNMINLSEGLLVINNTTDLSAGLPVINNVTNLSKRLPIINNTSAKMTCMIVFSINTMQSLVIEHLLLLPSSKHLRLEVLRVLRKFEYKLLRKDYL